MALSPTSLAPGQRYLQPTLPTSLARWRDRQITLAGVDRDALGLARATLRYPDGREVVVYAAQLEAALADGQFLSHADVELDQAS